MEQRDSSASGYGLSRRSAISHTVKACSGILIGSSAALGLTHKPASSPIRLALQRARIHAAELDRLGDLSPHHPDQANSWAAQQGMEKELRPVIDLFLELAERVDVELASAPWGEVERIYGCLGDELHERLWAGKNG